MSQGGDAPWRPSSAGAEAAASSGWSPLSGRKASNAHPVLTGLMPLAEDPRQRAEWQQGAEPNSAPRRAPVQSQPERCRKDLAPDGPGRTVSGDQIRGEIACVHTACAQEGADMVGGQHHGSLIMDRPRPECKAPRRRRNRLPGRHPPARAGRVPRRSRRRDHEVSHAADQCVSIDRERHAEEARALSVSSPRQRLGSLPPSR